MSTNEMILLGAALVFWLAIIPIVGGLMYARRERLLTHAERMKALEMCAHLPDRASTARILAAFGQPASADVHQDASA